MACITCLTETIRLGRLVRVQRVMAASDPERSEATIWNAIPVLR